MFNLKHFLTWFKKYILIVFIQYCKIGVHVLFINKLNTSRISMADLRRFGK